MSIPRLIIHNLSFHIDNTPVAFDDVDLSFDASKYGVVGDNGVGKTTFLKLLMGDLLPEKGSIQRHGAILYLPQSHNEIATGSTVADVLGVSNILSAISRIRSGEYQENDFDIVSNLWDMESRIQSALSKLHCSYININSPFHQLSGGEKMRAGLAISLSSKKPPQLIILDEPTNHLDLKSIEAIESILRDYQGAILAVSHDEIFLENIRITRTIEMLYNTKNQEKI